MINFAGRSPPGSGTPEELRRAESPAAIVQAAQYARGENAERAGSSKTFTHPLGCLQPTSATDNASSRIERHIDGREPVVCRGCAGLAATLGNDRPHCWWRGGAVPND